MTCFDDPERYLDRYAIMSSSVNPSLHDAVLKCIRYWKARGFSKTTARYYLIVFNQFLVWCTETIGFLPDLGEFTPEMLLSYANTSNKASSANLRINAIKSIFRGLYDLSVIDHYPKLLNVRTRPAPPVKRVPLTDSELRKIWEVLYNPAQPLSRSLLRQRVLFELLISWAPRVAELCSLRWTDFDVDNRTLTFKQKGGKLRTVSIGQNLFDALCSWAPRAPDFSIYIFRSRPGPNGTDGPPSREGLSGIIKKWFRTAGIKREEGFGPHLFRHTLATRAYLQSNDLELCRELLGHANSFTTLQYIHLPTNEVIGLSRSVSESFRTPEPVDADALEAKKRAASISKRIEIIEAAKNEKEDET